MSADVSERASQSPLCHLGSPQKAQGGVEMFEKEGLAQLWSSLCLCLKALWVYQMALPWQTLSFRGAVPAMWVTSQIGVTPATAGHGER